jgi:hypothetical protein
MTFDAAPPSGQFLQSRSKACDDVSVCSLGGAERFLVWALRWEASLHDDSAFARECLRESFERAGIIDVLPVFRGYVAAVHGVPSPCEPTLRLGCWKVNALEARTLNAVACLQAGQFGEAWRDVSSLAPARGAAGAMLALGEVADALSREGGRMRRWQDIACSQAA